MAKRKQLNIGLDPVQYAAVRAAAEAEGQTVTAYCRDAVLARAMSEPELPEGAALPLWLVHFLLFLTRAKPRPSRGRDCRGWPRQVLGIGAAPQLPCKDHSAVRAQSLTGC